MMHHTIITIDLAHIGGRDPEGAIQGLLKLINDNVAWSGPGMALDLDEWKVEVHQEHDGVSTRVPGWRAPEGVTSLKRLERLLEKRAFPVRGYVCPDCGQESIIGYLFVNEKQEHMHTHYVCTFWPSTPGESDPAKIKRQCGWHGWVVPDER